MKKNRIIVGLLFILVFSIVFSITLQAAQGSFSTSKTSVSLTEGGTTTFNIVATNCEGQFTISSSNSSVVRVSQSSVWVTGSQTITLTAVKAGSAKITIKAEDVGDTSENEVTGSKTISVTVSAKSSTTNTGSGSSGNSSSGSNSNKSTSTTTAPSFSSVNETVYATDSVNVRSSYSTSSSVIGSLSVGDSVTRTGVATRAVNGITWSRVTYNGRTAYISSSYLTKTKPEESDNNNLKSLTVEGFDLTPKFSSDVTEYNLTVEEDVNELKVEAVAEDDAAKVEITGNENLLIGENTIEIKVTAEDGTSKTYKINVTKGEAITLQLSELTVTGYTLTPEFNSDVYEYTLNIDDTSVTSINVDAKANTEDATIEIAGNTDLKIGENIVTILVKDGDEEVTTYQIIVNIEEKVEEQIIAGIDDNDLYLYGGIGAAALIVIIIIIAIVVKRRHKGEDDYEMYNGGFGPLNDNENIMDNSKDNEDIQDEDLKKKKGKKNKKDIIEENFGDNINTSDFDDDKPARRRGKHF